MDVIWDIDGTLADATHRLHHIVPDPNILYEQPFQKDWDTFLSDELVAKDAPMPQTWETLLSLLWAHNRLIFITGRPEDQRQTTYDWLKAYHCVHRAPAATYWDQNQNSGPVLYMCKSGDRRPSHVVKEEALFRARDDGFDPTLVFEDRADDTAMWRRNGLLCCQVAEGNY